MPSMEKPHLSEDIIAEMRIIQGNFGGAIGQLRALRTFIHSADEGGFAAAARNIWLNAAGCPTDTRRP
jgi:hypothetical protein